MIRFLLLTLTSVCCLQCKAQQQYTTTETANKKASKFYTEALELRNSGQTQKAISKLEQLIESDPLFIDAPLTLAGLQYENAQVAEAAKTFERAIALDSFYAPRVLYALGTIYLQAGEFSRSRHLFQRYLDRGNPEGKHKTIAEEYLQKAKTAEKIAAQPVEFKPQLLPGVINTESSEALPAFTIDGQHLLFTRVVHGQEDLYIAYWDSSQQTWINPEPMRAVNTSANEGAHAVSGDGSIIAFTACNKQDGAGSCDIYFWQRIDGIWQTPRNAGGINSAGWDGHPTFTSDGRGLYFSSDRPGGIGGRDIWYTERHDDRWTRPVNLGSAINTNGNEEAPFLFFDGRTLYFMSDGHPGIGDHDLFMSTRTLSGWTAPKNLGYPINTPGREGALTIHPDRQYAYYTSDRDKGQNDIYRFRLDSTLLPPPVSNLKGVVVDAETKAPVIAEIFVFNLADSTDHFQYTTDDAGVFSSVIVHGHTYGLHVTAKGYAFWSGQISYPLYEPYGQKSLHISLIPLRAEVATVAAAPIILRNIEFETASSTLRQSSIPELLRLYNLLQENPTIRIEIRGHTDNVGTEEDNLFLSEARAKTVYTWLINKGITTERLSYKGFGESKPIATNDTEDGRQQNRRTEFVVQ